VGDAGDAVGAEVVGPDEAQARQAHVHHRAQGRCDVDDVLRAVEHDDERSGKRADAEGLSVIGGR
jgi:hypothetical protein